jgi:ATP-binding cassette, subfamily C, bacterial
MISFFSHFGRFPRTWTILFLSVLSGMGEGIGLTMFIPLLEIMGGPSENPGQLFNIINNVFSSLEIPFSFIPLLVAIVLIIAGAIFISYIQKRMIGNSRYLFAQQLRCELFEGLITSKWKHLSVQPHGQVANDLTTETNRAGAALQMQILGIAAAIQAGVLIIISFIISWQMAIGAFVLGGIGIVLTRPLLKRASKLGQLNTDANQNYVIRSIDFLKGSRLIKASGSEKAVVDLLSPSDEKLYVSQRELEYNTALVTLILQTTPVLLLAIIMGVANSIFDIDFSHTLVFLLILARFAPRLTEIPMRYENFAGFLPGLIAADKAINTAKEHLEFTKQNNGQINKFNDRIEFKNVGFFYPGSDVQTINDISFEIPAKGITAIVGPSGAGKSTISDLIIGLHQPTTGQLLIDGKNVREIDLTSWREHIGYVSQDTITFNDSLRNNLTLTNPSATDKDLEEALRFAHLYEFTSNLPDKLETSMGENGVRLSGGQKQRLSLARALLGQPWLLLLDEATSALDSETEQTIQDSIDLLANKMSVLVIAHRLSTIRKAKMIHVIEDGHLIESGTYNELLEKNGRFSNLHNLQDLKLT